MLKEKVLETIEKYNMINNMDKNVLVAVSGGFDSTCLLYALNELRQELGINLYVAHINHCLRDNAIIDENYVIELGEKLSIPIFVKKYDINKIAIEEKISIEMAGREKRYEFFEEIAQKNNCTKIAVAHNANDNAETILLNMFRGTGLNGLKGIRKIRDNKYIRPLIEITRAEIDEYLNEKGIVARLDESNNSLDYRRNKIRNELLPYIEKNFNENIINVLNRMSDIITEEDEFLNKIVQEKYLDTVIKEDNDNIVINGKKIKNFEINIQKRLIISCISKLFNNKLQIEEVHIKDIIKMNNNNVGNKLLNINKKLKVYLNKGLLHFIKQK